MKEKLDVQIGLTRQIIKDNQEAKEKLRLKNQKLVKAYQERIKACSGIIHFYYGSLLAIKADGTVLSSDLGRYNVIHDWENIISISEDTGIIVGVKADGTVVAVGETKYLVRDVSRWRDIIDIKIETCEREITNTFEKYIIGLKRDGTVVATGSNAYGQCNVSGWSNITAIYTYKLYPSLGNLTIGLKKDGSLVASGTWKERHGIKNINYNFQNIKDVVKISYIRGDFIFLKKDGTVTTLSCYDSEEHIRPLNDIVEFAVCNGFIIGLKSDGTMAIDGIYKNCKDDKLCEWKDKLSEWNGIATISSGGSHIVGLKADGTIVATGYNNDGQCNVSVWKDIVAITAGFSRTVGVKMDGTVVMAGDDSGYNVADWKLFDSIDTLEQERKEHRRLRKERLEQERLIEQERKEQDRLNKIESLTERKRDLQNEQANLKGLFSGKRRKEIEEEINRINWDLNRLEKEK